MKQILPILCVIGQNINSTSNFNEKYDNAVRNGYGPVLSKIFIFLNQAITKIQCVLEVREAKYSGMTIRGPKSQSVYLILNESDLRRNDTSVEFNADGVITSCQVPTKRRHFNDSSSLLLFLVLVMLTFEAYLKDYDEWLIRIILYWLRKFFKNPMQLTEGESNNCYNLLSTTWVWI